MRVLYLDMDNLLYSREYLDKNKELVTLFREHGFFRNKDALLGAINPDRESARKLASAAYEAGLLLFPIGNRYSRDVLIKHDIFTDKELAPAAETRIPFRFDDSDFLRSLLAHAEALGAEWYVYGDICDDERASYFPKRFLKGDFGRAVTNEWLEKITQL